MTKLERTKLIDRYLSHEMSENERLDFEKLLFEHDLSYNGRLSLREEMNLQKDIECAIQERGLREMLSKREAQIKHKQHNKRIAIWSLGTRSLLTAVAAIMILLFITTPIAHKMQDYSTDYVAQLEFGSVRGGDTCTQVLTDALRLMQNNQWNESLAIVDNVLLQTTNAEDEAMQEMHDNAEWLKAICLMHNGQVIKAKRLLRKIADSNSPYQEQASRLLEQF